MAFPIGEMMITIFTPTYNRAYILNNLYESLRRQSSKNFQWIIVDDGSTDETENLVRGYIAQGNMEIIYKKRENGGKMRAINQGLDLASGELFFIVDSDDYLTDDAVEMIEKYSRDLPQNFAGMVFRKHNLKGDSFGKFPAEVIDSDPVEIFYRKKVGGDKAEVIRTDIMKQFRFPEIEGEKFVPEGLIWNRIGRRYKLRYIDRAIYNFEYIDDGYTNNFRNILKKNPEGMKLYYGEILKEDIPFTSKLKFLIRYIQSYCYALSK